MNYAKLLLFGEYSVLYGGNSLAVPYKRYGGELTLEEPDPESDRNSRWSNQQLYQLYGHILKSIRNNAFLNSFNLDRMAEELAHGLWFRSTIPGDSGFGSSGALVAAVTGRYCNDPDLMKNTQLLKATLAELEHSFHGNSSGIDPLVSFLNKPVGLLNKTWHFPDLSNAFGDSITLFLVHSQQSLKTKELVKLFREQMGNKPVNDRFKNQYIPFVNRLISMFLQSESNDWYSQLAELTALQQEFLKPVLHTNMQRIMEHGVKTKSYYLKILGSGGGYLLGFAENYTTAHNELKRLGINCYRLKNSDLML